MPMLEQKSGSDMGSTLPDAAFEQQQRRRMLIALAVLLLALISVLIKDRQFWFPPSPGSESEIAEQSAPLRSPLAASAKIVTPIAPHKPVGAAPAQARSKSSSKLAATAPAGNAAISPVITATNRAVLPPLEVEVVAGNQHRTVSPGDSSVNVEMQSGTSSASAQTTASGGVQDNGAGTSNAAAQVQLSPGNAQVVSRVNPSYPLLAKQMKVQGAVVLEALIGKTGSIQDIQVLSGPAILSAAAREAVKQWHFKPYYQSGRAVETEARITVNFTISTY
ncbi:MAG TPA: energy transducer TonB [Terriglobales bacterium]|nr:energy transducer TonB [Terriglobales bacterium]